MTVFYRKTIYDAITRKIPAYELSTETMDSRIYFGDTLEDALDNFKKDTGIMPTKLVDMQNW